MFACIWRQEAILCTVKVFDSQFLCLVLFHWSCTLRSLFLHSVALNEVIFSKTDSGAWLTTDIFLQAADMRRWHFWVCMPSSSCTLHISHKPSCRVIGQAIQPSDVSTGENTMLVSWTHLISGTLNCRKHQCLRYCTLGIWSLHCRQSLF